MDTTQHCPRCEDLARRLETAVEALRDGRDTLMSAAEDHCEGRYRDCADRITDVLAALSTAEGKVTT